MSNTRVYNQLGAVVIETETSRFEIESIDKGSYGIAYLRNNDGKVIIESTYSLLTGMAKKDKVYAFLIEEAKNR